MLACELGQYHFPGCILAEFSGFIVGLFRVVSIRFCFYSSIRMFLVLYYWGFRVSLQIPGSLRGFIWTFTRNPERVMGA